MPKLWKKRGFIEKFKLKKNEYIRTHVVPLKTVVLLHIQVYPVFESSESWQVLFVPHIYELQTDWTIKSNK